MINKLYKKTPENITRNEVEAMNDVKRSLNKKFEETHKFEINDIVKV